MVAASRKLRLKDKRRRMRIILFSLGVILFVGATVGIVMGLRMSEVNIASVSVAGTYYTDEKVVLNMIDGMLGGSYFFVIPRTNTFLYPKSAIERDIYSLFPTVREVRFSRIGFTGLSVTLVEREPHALWCSSVESDSPCYLMDEQGFVFAKTNSNEQNFVLYSGNVHGEPLSQTYLEGTYPKLASFVQNLITATNRKPLSVTVDEHNDVVVAFEDGGEVRFTADRADEALLDNIASVFASRRFQSDDEILEYADFRFGNKIYVKFKDE